MKFGLLFAILMIACVAGERGNRDYDRDDDRDHYRDRDEYDGDRDHERDRDRDYGRYRNRDRGHHGDRDGDGDRGYCKQGWVINGLRNKCYFVYPTLNTYSHFETQAFCAQLGGRVTEPKNQAEYDDAVSFVRKQTGWTDGPLLNIFAPAKDDTTVVLGSTFRAPSDFQLLSTLQAIATESTNGAPLENQCLTFSAALQVQFNSCSGLNTQGVAATNNPFCETPVLYGKSKY